MIIPIAKPSETIDVDYSSPLWENEGEAVFFHLQDSSHEFRMGLRDILKCIKVAEEQGIIPSLPKTWWDDLSSTYLEFREYNEPPKNEDR